jgi:uncharacterized protein
MAPAKIPPAIQRLLSSFHSQPFALLPLDDKDVAPISAILNKYEDLGLQLADASLVHLANRVGIELMFTLDRRDFGVLRLAHGKKLHLIP